MRTTTSVLLALLITAGVAPAHGEPDALDLAIDSFARKASIEVWPRLDVCSYDVTPLGLTAGLLLTVQNPQLGRSRWDGRCHVPFVHRLIGWPENLPPGTYLVAATATTQDQWSAARELRILDVMPTSGSKKQLEAALIKRVCASPPSQGTETDRDCEPRSDEHLLAR